MTCCSLENAEGSNKAIAHSRTALEKRGICTLFESILFTEVSKEVKRGALLCHAQPTGLTLTGRRYRSILRACFLPHRPISTRLSGAPSPCCRCSETGWCRASWCGRHTSWFPPSWAEIPVTVNPSHRQAEGVNKRVPCGMLPFR